MSSNVLFEIGLEELPARFIDNAENQLLQKTKKWLEESRIIYEGVNTFSTPRRLAVLINGIANEQSTIEEEVRGPSEKIGKNEDGEWSKAAIGFSRGQGKSVEDIFLKEVSGTSYIFIEKRIEGKPIIDILPSFQAVIESIEFPQSMRWGSESIRYARPIRWLVALYNHVVIPFDIAHVKTGNVTQGHRFLGSEIELTDPVNYEKQLLDNFVVANKDKREQLIIDQIKDLEAQEKFTIQVDPDLLVEVRNLVEYPTAFFGRYEDEFLELPAEVLVTSMQEHQRYFPVKDQNDKLLPYFVGVRNGDAHEIDNVARGNEKVLQARLADGQFFYEEDLKRSINHNLEKLDRVVFQEKLGTTADKVKRIVASAEKISSKLNLDHEMTEKVIRTAEISKFDLMTDMVNEFTELQGVMGEKYALYYGEDKLVAQAVREHYLPKQASGDLPESLPGAIVSIADKLDSIVGFISVGLTPSGSQDPYSLRRQALGVLRILEARAWDISVEEILSIAESQYDLRDNQDIVKNTHEFFRLRVGFLLREKGIEQDIIDAVTKKEIGVFSYTMTKADLLAKKRNDDAFKDVEEALVRVLNLSKDKEDMVVDESLFIHSSESLLFETYKDVKAKYDIANENYQAVEALNLLSELANPIHDFFENNMIMAEDLKLRKNRLGLVNTIAQLIESFADLTLIQWKQHG